MQKELMSASTSVGLFCACHRSLLPYGRPLLTLMHTHTSCLGEVGAKGAHVCPNNADVVFDKDKEKQKTKSGKKRHVRDRSSGVPNTDFVSHRKEKKKKETFA